MGGKYKWMSLAMVAMYQYFRKEKKWSVKMVGGANPGTISVWGTLGACILLQTYPYEPMGQL